jgi:hypothetical protein
MTTPSERTARPALAAVILLLLSVTAGATPKEPFAGTDDKWRHYQSPNFELFSHGDDGESRQLLFHMELLRATFLEANKLAERQPVGVTVYLFRTQKEFDAYKPDAMPNVAGLYLHRPDRAVILVAPSNNQGDSKHVIYHEYLHHLIRVTGMDPPAWLNEGMAELFSTVETKSGKLIFGGAIPWHVYQLANQGTMPLAALLGTSVEDVHQGSADHTGLFYAQSWALLHYWYFGAQKMPRGKLDPFIRQLMQAPRSIPVSRLPSAYLDATGETYEQTERNLERYMKKGRYTPRELPLPKIPPSSTYAVRSLSRDSIRERLAEVLLRTRRDPRAKFALLEATKGPESIRALEALGSDALVDQQDRLAQERWEEAIEKDTANPAIYHQVGILESRRWFANFDYYFRLPPDRAERLRRLLMKSIEVAPDQSEAYEMLAWVEASTHNPDFRNVNLVQRHYSALINKPRTLVALAMLRIRLGSFEEAEKILEQVGELDPEPAAVQAARFLRKLMAEERGKAAIASGRPAG